MKLTVLIAGTSDACNSTTREVVITTRMMIGGNGKMIVKSMSD
jgi:hypothetical protein